MPKLCKWILGATAPKKFRQALLDEVEIDYESELFEHGPRKANRWAWGQALRSVFPLIWTHLVYLLITRLIGFG